MDDQWMTVGRWLRSSWWASGEREQPRSERRVCGRTACGASTAGPFDLFCAGGTTSHLVIGDGDVRAQAIAVWTLRAACGALVLIAAAANSPVALYVGAGILGLLGLALPLREFRIAGVVAPTLWVGALACATSARQGAIDAQTGEAIALAVVGIVAMALVAAVALRDASGQMVEKAGAGASIRGVALVLVFAVVTGVAGMVCALGVGRFGSTAQAGLLIASVTGLGAVLCGSVISGFLAVSITSIIGDRRPQARDALMPPGYLFPSGAGHLLTRALLIVCSGPFSVQCFV